MDLEMITHMIEEGRKDTEALWANLRALHAHGICDTVEMHWIMGHACGYKTCCVRNFINLNNLGIPAAGFMHYILGHKHIPGTRHVLCPLCYDEHMEYLRPEWLNDPAFGKEGTRENWTKESWMEEVFGKEAI